MARSPGTRHVPDRVVHHWLDRGPAGPTLLALGTTTAALAIRPRLAWLAAPYVVGVAVLAALPSLGVEVALVAVLGGFAATAIAWSRGV